MKKKYPTHLGSCLVLADWWQMWSVKFLPHTRHAGFIWIQGQVHIVCWAYYFFICSNTVRH